MTSRFCSTCNQNWDVFDSRCSHCFKALESRIKELEKVIRHCKSTTNFSASDIQSAYVEGFEDGENHGTLSWKYQPMTNAFAMSEARKLIAGLPDDTLQLTIAQWRNAKMIDQHKHVLTMDAVVVTDDTESVGRYSQSQLGSNESEID